MWLPACSGRLSRRSGGTWGWVFSICRRLSWRMAGNSGTSPAVQRRNATKLIPVFLSVLQMFAGIERLVQRVREPLRVRETSPSRVIIKASTD